MRSFPFRDSLLDIRQYSLALISRNMLHIYSSLTSMFSSYIFLFTKSYCIKLLPLLSCCLYSIFILLLTPDLQQFGDLLLHVRYCAFSCNASCSCYYCSVYCLFHPLNVVSHAPQNMVHVWIRVFNPHFHLLIG